MAKSTNFSGLSSQEAAVRLNKHGFNEIDQKKKISWLKILFDQLKSPLIYILIFAGIVTLFLKEYTDSIVIFAAVLVNTILGFFQEAKAEKSLMLLQQLVVPHTWVFRDNEEKSVKSKQVVPGDIVILKTGEKIPADGVLLISVDLYVNEAILTGESEAVKKESYPYSNKEGEVDTEKIEKEKQVFMGTIVVTGRGRMLVTKTGMKTEMGKIASGLSQTTEGKTPLRNQIDKLSKVLAIVMMLICVLIFVEGLIKGKDLVEMFTLSVAVAVAAIPEGLVISVTTILVLGMQRLLASKALVRRLLAAETLGSVSTICADKTGTLTEGKMRLIKVETDNSQLLIKAILQCNNLITPVELSMFDWAESQLKKNDGLTKEKLLSQKRIDEIPFSSEKKYIAILYDDYLYISGAPERVLSFCKLSDSERKKWEDKIDQLSKQGYRLVSLAYSLRKKGERRIKKERSKNEFNWLGLVIFEDPVRKDVGAVLKECQRAGINVKVVTGDFAGTAIAVLNQLGIAGDSLKEENTMSGSILEKISEEELKKTINTITLFYRTTPQQKIKIVKALQEKNEIVAMMGDGVNDALALKKADIGIVVGDASDVAKETADMVLLDSNFKTILEAIKVGRAIFQNIRKVVLYLLSDSLTEVALVGGSLLVGLPIPILAVQILWVNLVEDGLPGISLAFEPEEKGLLSKPPRKKGEPIIDKEIRTIIFIIGIVTNLGLFAIFIALYKLGYDLEFIRTIIFVGLGLDSLLYIYSCKSLNKNIWEIPILNNLFLNISVIIGLIMLLVAVYLPFMRVLLKTVSLPLWAFSLLIVFAMVKVAIIEGVKRLFKEQKNALSI